MNFLGLGPGELMLIAMLGLIVFGPGKLPEIAAQVGKAVRDFRQSTSEITSEFQRSFSLEELTAGSKEAESIEAGKTILVPDPEAVASTTEPAAAWSWDE